MNKAKVIGLTVTVLAVIGGVAVYNWAKKPKRNSEGFFNATGMSPFFQQTSDRNKDNFSNMSGYMNVAGRPLCTRINEDGSRTQYSSQGGSKPCPYGGKVIASN